MCFAALCCAGSALCCAGTACCGCLCKLCGCCGINSKVFAKIGFVIFQLFWAIVSIIFLFTIRHFVDILPSFMQCPEASGNGIACMGASNIVRMSFVLACFHLFVFCMIIPRQTASALFHDGCWLFKFIFVMCFYTTTMWIPNWFFKGYADFARYISVFFLIYQALLMLVVAYKINEVLVGNYQKDQSGCSGAIIIGMTILFTGISIVWLVFQYIWYGSCGYNDFYISITILFGIAYFIIVIFRTREDASILTSSIVLLYNTYLLWSALASNPNSSCNPFQNSATNTVFQIILGLFFTYIALLIISGSTKKSDENNLTAKMNQPMMENEEDNGERLDDVEKVGGGQVDQDKMHAFPVSSGTILFQALLILSAIYLSMLLTNWGNPALFDDTTDFFEANNTSFWIKLIAQWISILIYLFSLIAPILFPGREF